MDMNNYLEKTIKESAFDKFLSILNAYKDIENSMKWYDRINPIFYIKRKKINSILTSMILSIKEIHELNNKFIIDFERMYIVSRSIYGDNNISLINYIENNNRFSFYAMKIYYNDTDYLIIDIISDMIKVYDYNNNKYVYKLITAYGIDKSYVDIIQKIKDGIIIYLEKMIQN